MNLVTLTAVYIYIDNFINKKIKNKDLNYIGRLICLC